MRITFIIISNLCLWFLANFPALVTSWWYLDDYAQGILFDPKHSLQHGRPVQVILFFSFLLDRSLYGEMGNIVLRLGQGVFHCLTTYLAARLLHQQTKRQSAYFAFLLFLIWPFNGEAVLWRSASAYPVAAFLSMLGVFLLCDKAANSERMRKFLGSALIVLAVLTNQTAALAGLIVWFMTIGARLLQGREHSFKLYVVEGAWIITSYMLGVTYTRLLIQWIAGFSDRAELTADPSTKLMFLKLLNQEFLFSANYPAWLAGIHLLILGSAVGLLIAKGIQERWRFPKVLMSMVLLGSMGFAPYIANLLVAESWPTWRIMYLAPALLVNAWFYSYILVDNNTMGKIFYSLLLCGALWGYFTISWQNAADYVNVYQADRNVLTALEIYAEQHNFPKTVVVAGPPEYLRTWNLHNSHYMFGDSKLSAFLRDWTFIPFVHWFSTLQPVPNPEIYDQQDPVLKSQCTQQCLHLAKHRPFFIAPLEGVGSLCLCP